MIHKKVSSAIRKLLKVSVFIKYNDYGSSFDGRLFISIPFLNANRLRGELKHHICMTGV